MIQTFFELWDKGVRKERAMDRG